MSNKEFERAAERRVQERLNRPNLRGDMATKAFTTGLIDDENINKVYLGEICDRHKNDFIVNDNKLAPLILSIRKSGVGQPILLTNIDDQINNIEDTLKNGIDDIKIQNDLSERLSYLVSNKNKGKKYVLVSGHRRFKACKYLFLETNQKYIEKHNLTLTYENINEVFDIIIEDINEVKDSVASLLDSPDYDDTFENIPATIQELSQDKEHSLYEDTNLTQREISTFEIITKVKDKIDEELNSDSRPIFIKKYLGENAKTSNVNKGDLYKAYIKEELGIENISRQNVFKTLKIIENATTPKIFEYILNGKLTINEAEVLSRKDNIPKQAELIERIEKGLPLFDTKKQNSEEQEEITPEAKVKKCALSIKKQIDELEKAMSECVYQDNRKDASKKSNRDRMLKKLKAISIEEFIKKI